MHAPKITIIVRAVCFTYQIIHMNVGGFNTLLGLRITLALNRPSRI